MGEVVKDSITPLVQRILADPLRFIPAKYQETHTNRPSSYIKIGASHSKELVPERAGQQQHQRPLLGSAKPANDDESKPRPRSLAHAIAGYTGKRVLDDDDGKLSKSKRKKLKVESVLAQSENDEDVGESLEGEDETAQASNEDEEALSEDETPLSADETAQSEDDEESYQAEESRESSEDAQPFPRNLVSKKVYEQFPSENSDESRTASTTSEEDTGDGNSNDDDDDDDDEDYNEAQTNTQEESTSESSESRESSQSPDSPCASESQEDENELLKKDLHSKATSSTPPTTPESDSEEDKVTGDPNGSTDVDKRSKLDDFYQINEIANDRGSNHSQRIVKNWGVNLQLQKPVGLLNHGVTCYTNAAVQAMVHIPAVQHYLNDIYKNKYKDTISQRSVSHVLAETSVRMWNPDKKRSAKYINPKKLVSRLDDINCMMSEWQQEDSHEYFMSLLSRLQEDSTPKGHKLNESIIYDIFGGLLNQSVTCKSCGHVSKTQQEFYDLSLHLGSTRKNSNSNDNTQEDADQPSQRYSIQKSIRDFFSPELIKPDRSDTKSGYVCEKCKQRTNAIKISSIDRAPETLAVHLKRFRFNGSSSSKVKQGVSYPLILDLSQYTTRAEPVLYQLISVVVHAGRSVSSGHYIAHCRQPDGTWATYDDEYINPISEKQALKDSSAYYLIYTRLTHKDNIKKPTPLKALQQSNVSSSPATKPVSTKLDVNQSPRHTADKDRKPLHSIGAVNPSSPKQHVPQMPKHNIKAKKQKYGAMRPTNNLGNISGKNQRKYASKRPGSRRFKKY